MADGKAKHLMLPLVIAAPLLLLANWFIVATILGRGCALPYEGGNITECVGGLSEEESAAASALIALAMLIIQTGLVVLVRRRIRSTS